MEIYYCFLVLLLISVTMEIYRNTNGYACAYGTWGSAHLSARQKPVMFKDTRMQQVVRQNFTVLLILQHLKGITDVANPSEFVDVSVFVFCYPLFALQGNSGFLLHRSGKISMAILPEKLCGKSVWESMWEIYRYQHDMNHDNFQYRKHLIQTCTTCNSFLFSSNGPTWTFLSSLGRPDCGLSVLEETQKKNGESLFSKTCSNMTRSDGFKPKEPVFRLDKFFYNEALKHMNRLP